MKMGFFQDFEELSLEELLTPTEATVSVASRLPETVERTPGTVTLLKGDDIRKLGARTLEDALRLLPGVDITRDRLGRSKIALRGVTTGFTGGVSENVLVLLNGDRLNESVLGGAGTLNFNLPADHVKQVELLRGPASALYGDGALAGVISIVLQSVDDFMGTELLAGGGSFGTQDYAIRSGAVYKRLQISGFVRFLDSRGARTDVPADAQTAADRDRAAQGLPPISLAPGPTTDGYRTIETAYRLGLGEWSLGLRSRSDGWDGLVGWADALGRQNSLATRQTNIDLAWKRENTRYGVFEARLVFAQNQIRHILEIYPSGFATLTASGEVAVFGKPHSDGGVFLDENLASRRWSAEGIWHRDLDRHRLVGGLTFGIDKTHDLKADSNFDFRTDTQVPGAPGGGLGYLPAAVAHSKRSVFGAYLQDEWTVSDRVTLTTGLRFDHIWGVGGTASPRIALVGRLPSGLEKKLPSALGSGLSWKLLYGRSFRAPTFSELYFSLPGYTGNPGLQTMVADSFEGGLSYKSGQWRASVTGYLNLVDRTIETGRPFDPVGSTVLRNGEGVRVFGFESDVRKSFGASHALFANYTYQHAVLRESDLRAPEVPAHLANLGVNLLFHDRFNLTPTLILRSSRPRRPLDPRPATEGTVAFGLAGQAHDLFRVRGLGADLRIDDLFDDERFDPAPLVPGDYPQPGFRVLAHVTYRF
jgi:iron complex outermembrane receptor protein